MELSHAHKKIIRRTLLTILALIFIAEAWLWDKTGAAIKKLVAELPLEELKQKVAAFIDALSPIRTVFLFVIPVLVLLPIKFMALWFVAHGFVFGGVGMILLAKLAGLGVSSYLFTLCKPKLLELAWVRWLYKHCLIWREKAAKLVRPYTAFVHAYRKRLLRRFPQNGLLSKLRTRMHNTRNNS